MYSDRQDDYDGMKRRVSTLTILGLLWVTLPAFTVDSAATDMVTISYSVNPGAFKTLLSGTTTNEIDTLQKLFTDAGVPFPPGSTLAFHERTSELIHRNTTANQSIFERVLDTMNVVPVQAEIEVKLVRICDPEFCQRLTPAPTTELPTNQVEELDRISVITVSGSQARAERRQLLDKLTERKIPPAPAVKSSTNDAPVVSTAPAEGFGTTLNVTPTIGPDGYGINLTLAWDYRRLNGWKQIPGSTAEATIPDITEKSLITSIMLNDGISAVLSLADSDSGLNEKIPKMSSNCVEALIITPRLRNPGGGLIHRFPKPTKRAATISSATTTGMVTRSYPVTPGAFRTFATTTDASTNAPDADLPIKKLFMDAGVAFPEGSKFHYDERNSRIIITNTPENLDIFARVVSYDGCYSQAEIDVKLVRVSDRSVLNNPTINSLTNFPSKTIEVLAHHSVLTASGCQAQSYQWRTLQWPPVVTNTVLTSRPPDAYGSQINVTSTVGPDGRTLNLTLIWESGNFDGWETITRNGQNTKVPKVLERNITTSLVLWDGDAILVNTSNTKAEDQLPEFLILSARIINDQGLPIRERYQR